MRRGGLALACALALAAAAAPVRAEGARPVPPRSETLPRTLAVDEFEYLLRPSHLTVAAGRVRIRVYNRGMDDHDLAVRLRSGGLRRTAVAPSAAASLALRLRPGAYKVFCSLFAGTPESHEALGMHFTLRVR